MSDDRKLRIWFDDYEWVIAYDEADADAVYVETVGCAHGSSESTSWQEWDRPLSLTEDDGETFEKLTAEECIAKRGRCYLGAERD